MLKSLKHGDTKVMLSGDTQSLPLQKVTIPDGPFIQTAAPGHPSRGVQRSWGRGWNGTRPGWPQAKGITTHGKSGMLN